VAAEQVTEQVAQGLEEVAMATRRVDVRGIGLFSGGLVVGVAVGFYFGYRWNKEKLKAEAFRESADEVATLRKVYQERERRHEEARKAEMEKVMASQTDEKPSVDEVMRQKGYTSYSSMGPVEEERPLPPPVPGVVTPPRRPVAKPPFEPGTTPPRAELNQKDKMDGWVYAQELTQRSPSSPYIIHQDEFDQNESGYDQVEYTYYDIDDVLTDTDDTVLNNRENLIGVNTLRWGHGTDDWDLVYIRNPKLEIEFRIWRLHQSFEENVLGHQNDPAS